MLIAAAICLRPADAPGDVIITAEGETVSGHQCTITDGVVSVPGDPPRSWALHDLQRITFAPARPTDELKTRIVRLELPGEGKMLHVAEVQVFVGEENIALKGTAKQSSLYMDNTQGGWGPEKANDGKTGGDSRVDGVNHTNQEANPWWEVDLGQSVVVTKVVVWNRTDDNVSGRIAGVRVVLLDENRKPNWVRAIPEPPNPSLELTPPPRGDAMTEDDLRAFEEYSRQQQSTGFLGALAGWLGSGGAAASQNQPAAATPAVPAADFPDDARQFELADGGRLIGRLTGWDASGAQVSATLGGQAVNLVIPAGALKEVLSKPAAQGQKTIDRAQAAGDLDTVFAEAEGGALQAVKGKVLALEGDSLQFEFQGKPRKIALSRIAAILPAGGAAPEGPAYGLLEIRPGQMAPCRIVSLDDNRAVCESVFGGRFEVPRGVLGELTIRNGRILNLGDLDPSKTEFVPFLDRQWTYTVNTSLLGQPLRVGNETFPRGLCTHSRTVLAYDLSQGYVRLRARIGLQSGDGDRGDALVRITGDGAVLWEKTLKGKAAAEPVDLDLSGRRALQLEVDFGDQFDVGDHVVWGDPVLVRRTAP